MAFRHCLCCTTRAARKNQLRTHRFTERQPTDSMCGEKLDFAYSFYLIIFSMLIANVNALLMYVQYRHDVVKLQELVRRKEKQQLQWKRRN